MRHAGLGAFILLACSAAAASGIEFKGLALGSSEATLAQAFPWVSCKRSADPALADRACFRKFSASADAETIAGVPAQLAFYLYGDRLHSIYAYFEARRFDQVVEALQQKYGRPTKVEREAVRNGYGAQFANVVYLWKVDGDLVSAEKFSGDLNTSHVRYATDWADQEYARRSAASTVKAAKDL